MHIGKRGISENEFIERMEKQKQILYRIAYGYLHSETLAVDAVDEAVYQGFVHRKQIKQPEYFETWLTRILIHECIRVLSKGKKLVPLDSSPEQCVPSREEASLLYMAVDKLEEACKKVILLRYFGGYTIAETAEILDMPEGTVATKTRQALTALRLELDDGKYCQPDKALVKGGAYHE